MILDFFKKKKRVKGLISYYGLTEWWLSSFSNEERGIILKTYKPLTVGFSEDPDEKNHESELIYGDIIVRSQSVAAFLMNLSACFSNKQNEQIELKILKKAEECLSESLDMLDHHFFYHHKIITNYKKRETRHFYDIAVDACLKQIEIAPSVAAAFLKKFDDEPLPGHTGYYQLAVIFEKNKEFDLAIDLCRIASNQGWCGDWEHRIERCMRKKTN